MSDAQLRLTGSVHCIPWKLSITSEWLGKSNFEAVIKFSKNFLTHYAWNLKYSRMCILRLSATSYCLQNFWHDMKLKHWEIFSNILVTCFINLVTWIFEKAYSGFKTAHYPFTKFVKPKLKIFSFWRLRFQERNCKTRRYFRENSLWPHSWRHP